MTQPAKMSASQSQTWTENHPAFQISLARRMLAREGCESRVAGHVSLRASENSFWVSTFGYFDETLPEQVIKVDFEMNKLEGTWEPSPAIAFHASLMRARPEVNSIVHIHSRWVEALSTTGCDLGMYSTDSVLFFEDQAHYSDDGIQKPVDGERMARELGAKNVLIMDNHGALVVAETLQIAAIKAIALESSARCHAVAQLIGGKEIPPVEAARSKADYNKYFIPMMWEAGCRRLQKSDPELFACLEG